MGNRTGFSLIEILVSLGIISLLAGLLFPAIQAVREAARRANCQNNLRQLALGSLNFESVNGSFPGPVFDGLPSSSAYKNDRGLFHAISSYIEIDFWSEPKSSFRDANALLLTKAPVQLICPSAPTPYTLNQIASHFSGEATSLVSQTCDYIGNGGSGKQRGTIGLAIKGRIRHVRPADVQDGLSNTFLLWESVGGQFIHSRAQGQIVNDIESSILQHFNFSAGDPDEVVEMESSTVASSKSYLHAWAGLRIGNVRNLQFVVNESNMFGQIYATHPAGANVSYADGSVQFLSEASEPGVVIGMAANSDGK